MSITQPDERELKLKVTLSAIYMPEVGQANGYYSVFNFAPDPQNLRPINYDNKNNNPKIVFNTGGSQAVGFQYADFKLGSRVKFLPALQNAHIVETITHPTASSCTFAFGGILNDVAHPIFNSLRGPSAAEYAAFNLAVPVRSSTVTNLSTPNLLYNFSDLENFKPLIPFIKEYSYTSTGTRTFSPIPSYTDPITFSHWVMFNNLSNYLYTSYNIWNLVDANEAPLSTSVKEYEGPVGANVSGKSYASIKTIRDGINGSRLFVDSKGKGKSCIVKRIFPTSKDVIFNNPYIFFPTKIRNTFFGTEYLVLNGERINSQSSVNTGFHIQLTNLSASSSDSNISFIYEDKSPKDNSIYSVTINLTPNALPQIITKYKSNGLDFFYKYDQIKAPLFDGKSTLGYDIFLHFVGPVMLIGFSSDQATWNAIYPEEVASSNTVVDPAAPLQDKANIEHYFGKDTSFVKILAMNASFEMRYSSVLFNNYCKPSSVSTNNYENLRSLTFSSVVGNILGFGAGLELLNTKNQILMTFTAPTDKANLINASSINDTFHSAKYYGKNGPRYQTIPDKTISAMPDWRSLIPTTGNPSDFVYKQIASSIDTNTPYNKQQYSKTWGNLFFNGTIEGPAFLSLESPALNTFKQVDFLYDIKKGELTPWVSDVTVNCNTDLANFSLIKKSATISLVNLDTTIDGLNLLELMEQNILVVTVRAGYGNPDAIPSYFQGVITSVSSSRSGSQSNISLDCQDLGNYIMDGLFFDYIVPFGNRSIKTCIQAIMNFSGFSKYYTLLNEAMIGGLNLRIVNNPAAAPDAIRATNFDKISEKMSVFLSKLMTLEKLPTFRWDEQSGFILDARYAANNLDDDLKFFGYDATPNSTNQTLSMRNTTDNKTPDWHGLLTGNFSVNTRLSPLSYHVSTYGFTYEGLIERHTSEKYHDLKMSTQSRDSVVNSILTGIVPKSYVGFRKKVIDSLEKNEFPTSELVELKHAQNEKITTIPIHDLSFNCYVTKPLKFHGLFRINALADAANLNDPTLSITSKYIYQSVNYTINKSQNLITAQVNGFSHPWLIQDLKVSGDT